MENYEKWCTNITYELKDKKTSRGLPIIRNLNRKKDLKVIIINKKGSKTPVNIQIIISVFETNCSYNSSILSLLHLG